MRTIHILAAVIAASAASAGCFSSATAARRSQTLSSEGWSCYADPVIECPNRPRGECTGHDQRWIARCPDSGATYVCRFANEGAQVGDPRLNDRRVFCSR